MVEISRTIEVESTARLLQLAGLFDLPVAEKSTMQWSVELPLQERPWQIGLIFGPSGCGKSTVAAELWPDRVCRGFDWPANQSLVEGFPQEMGIQEITGLLSSVGFSSPPSWVRPFRVLSNGEQFRATIARAMAEASGLFVVDEFTSVVDRTVARIGSAAVAKAVRARAGVQFVAVACHDDIVEWLCPDWTYEPAVSRFLWRGLQRRPAIELRVRRAELSEWRVFRAHHYLSGRHHRGAKAFIGFVEGRPATWSSWIWRPGVRKDCSMREHRTVCLPDFQGVGVGNAMSAYCAGLMRAVWPRVTSTTANPAMVRHRAKSPLWRMLDAPHVPNEDQKLVAYTGSAGRCIASFLFVGEPRYDEARAFGLQVRRGK